VGSLGKAGAGAQAARRAVIRARQAQSGRGFRGCDLRECEKEGLAVGPTQRGKGTKIVAVASVDGLPLAVPMAARRLPPHPAQTFYETVSMLSASSC
jgi:hypothetical protein